MGHRSELELIRAQAPADAKLVDVVWRPVSHAPGVVRYAAVTASPGLILGVRLPSEFPRTTKVLSLRFAGQPDHVVGLPPIVDSLKKLQVWVTRSQRIELDLQLPENLRADVVAANLAALPYAVQVRAAENGAERVGWVETGAYRPNVVSA